MKKLSNNVKYTTDEHQATIFLNLNGGTLVEFGTCHIKSIKLLKEDLEKNGKFSDYAYLITLNPDLLKKVENKEGF